MQTPNNPIASGIYRPVNFGSADNFAPPAPAAPYSTQLSTFTGNPNGEWNLYIADDTINNSGALAGGWSLFLDTSNLRTDEDTPLEFSTANSNAISIDDVDAANNPIGVTLNAVNGTISLSDITESGLNFTSSDGSKDSTMSFTGTITNIKQALNRMKFDPQENFNGLASIEIITNDQGIAGGSGTAKTDSDTIFITVNPRNDKPILNNSTFNITEGGTITLTRDNISASDVESTPESLTFTVSNITNGKFQLASQPGQAITNFTQAQINAGQVKFVHDGTEEDPTFDISVSDATDTTTPITISNIGFTKVNDAPKLVNNKFTITEGLPLTLTESNLSADDEDNDNRTLSFTASEVTNGSFEVTEQPVTSFTQADIIQGKVKFVHKGSSNAPSFKVKVSDSDTSQTADQTTEVAGNISFTPTNDTPILINRTFNITEGESVILDNSNFNATDEESMAENITFLLSNITGGKFELVTTGNLPAQEITSFTQAQINAKQIKFIHNGWGKNAPSYSVSVSDGNSGNTLPAQTSITKLY
ncbi:MAG: hypothetical protein HC908_10600 [Calothrix sp. SM1_7_51]|nr:hypothetical protein [Calothrix sp. SM1_7_51]